MKFNFKKYSSIENIRKSSEVLAYNLVITEKIDGTNVRFFCSEEGLHVGSRNNVIWKPGFEGPQYDGFNFYDYISVHPCIALLIDTKFIDYIFYGEWHGPGIQKGIVYSKEKDLRIFDIRHPQGFFLNWGEVREICAAVGLKTVPEIFRGKIIDIKDLNSLLNVNSQCAIENGIKLDNNIAEGIVLKPLMEKLDKRGHRIIIKYKSEKWAENAEGSTKIRKQLTQEEMDLVTAAKDFTAKVVTQGRLHCIIEHITRDGNTEIDIKRTGEFLRAFIQDVMKEYQEEVYDKLERKDMNFYNKTINQQASRLFKQYVMET